MVLSKEPLLPTQLPDMMAIVTCYNLEIMYMYDKHIQQHNQCNCIEMNTVPNSIPPYLRSLN